MFGSIALDVATGMVLIYLLYSLLATIIEEMISSWLGLRARGLKTAIERMLNDEKIKGNKKLRLIELLEGIANLFSQRKKKHAAIKNIASEITRLAQQQAEEYAAIKHKASELSDKIDHLFIWRKQKYAAIKKIANEIARVADRRDSEYVNIINRAGNLSDEIDRLFHQQKITRTSGRRDSGLRNSLAEKFYGDPAIKYLAEEKNKWFSPSTPSYLSKETFAQTLVHLFRGKGVGNSDAERVGFCLKFNTLHIEPQTLSYLRNLLADAHGSLDAFAQSLQNWFEETMDRATGWYKRKNRIILFLVGLTIAISFNVDSIRIARFLSKDKDARGQLVSLGIAAAKDSLKFRPFINQNGDSVTSIALLDSGLVNVTGDLRNANAILGEGWDFTSLTSDFPTRMLPSDSSEKRWIRDKVDSIRFYNKTIKDLEMEPALYWSKDSIGKSLMASLSKEKERRSGYLNVLNKRINSKFIEVDTCYDSTVLKEAFLAIIGKVPAGFGSKVSFVLSGILASAWGFLITALMISLGAPFWFNLLQKLLSLRSAGVKPEEKEETKSQPDGTPTGPSMSIETLAPKQPVTPETPVQVAMRIYSEEIRKVKGVINVLQGYYKADSKVYPCVQINVQDQDTGVLIRSKYSRLRVSGDQYVPTTVYVTGPPLLRAAPPSYFIMPELAIGNKTLINGWGSFGFLARDVFGTQRFLISCFHVLNGTLDWDEVVGSQTIIDASLDALSTSYRGYLNNNLDAGKAVISDEVWDDYVKRFPNPPSSRDVDQSDVHTTIVTARGARSGVVGGTIVNDSCCYDLDYDTSPTQAKRYHFEDLIAISHAGMGSRIAAITQQGDSGGLVTDSSGSAVGIVLAGDAVFTYAMKMSNILSQLSITLS